jgi:uncharacterized damage-inducible protein DinB
MAKLPEAAASRVLPNPRGQLRLPEGEGRSLPGLKMTFSCSTNTIAGGQRGFPSGLNTEEFTRDLGGSFRSVRDTLVHIVGSERSWLTCWKEPSPTSAFIDHRWTRYDILSNPNAFPDLTAVQSKWAEIESEQIEFVNRLTNESWRRMLPVRTTRISLAHLMQHLANHSTYHRGQLSLMMRQLAAKPLATDFAMFLMEGRCESAGAQEAAQRRF